MLEPRNSGEPAAPDIGFPVEPRELKIEITADCDLGCEFCYQGDGGGRSERHMPEDEVLRWIDWAVNNGLTAVRFTGGEPTLHPRLKVFCAYARLRRRYVILNTNGMGSDPLYKDLFPLIQDLRISLPLLDAGRLDELTRGRRVLERKMAVTQQALSAGVQRVSMLTPLLPENQGRLEAFVKLAQASQRLHWLPMRYEPTPNVPRPWTRRDAQKFAEEVSGLMDRYPEQAGGIFLAVPFCAVSPIDLGARVFHGRVRDCGPYVSLNVSARGRLQACCCVSDMEGVGTLAEITNRLDFQAVCAKSTLSEECRRCPHVSRCAGGCRKPAGLVRHRGGYIDYLAGFVDEPSMQGGLPEDVSA